MVALFCELGGVIILKCSVSGYQILLCVKCLCVKMFVHVRVCYVFTFDFHRGNSKV
jgi:hypothetical protein